MMKHARKRESSRLSRHTDGSNATRSTVLTLTEATEIDQITYANGDIYEGEVKNGKRNGHGTMTFKDGTCFMGRWEDDKPSYAA